MKQSIAVIALVVLLTPHEGLPDPASDERMGPADDVRPATVFFRGGLSVKELHQLQVKLSVEVMDVMMKAPQGDARHCMAVAGISTRTMSTAATPVHFHRPMPSSAWPNQPFPPPTRAGPASVSRRCRARAVRLP